MRQVHLPLNREDVMQHIPHRDPFLLVDRITVLEPNQRVEGYYTIPVDLPLFRGHFPERAIYPGVLIIEGLAQASGILGRYAFEKESIECMLTEVSATRFRRPALPGETLHYKLLLKKRRGPFFWFEGEAFVGEEACASAAFSAMMR